MTNVIAPSEMNVDLITNLAVQKRKGGNPGARDKKKYKNIISAFDIETSRIREIEQSFMYVWQWQFGLDTTVMGRTWEEFINLCRALTIGMKENEYICVFVHNLSYEFQFLRGIYDFQPEEVFAIDSRKVLKLTMFDHIEMRCSYLHSNMSLYEYTHKMQAPHPKLEENDFDYTIVRYPWTKLEGTDLEYAVNDVLGLVESIQIEMEHDNDNLYSFPLTSTGYVRRDAKKAMRTVSHMFVKNQLLDYEIYEMCREAFRGGNTHANRYYSGVVLHNVRSADRKSSYPDVQCNCQFPVSKFFRAGATSYDDLLNLINVRKKAVLMRIALTNIRLHDEFWGCPYIPRDKCRNIRNALYDNGRILQADYLETTVTDIDFRIILSEYDFDDCAPFDVAHARYGNLPPQLIETTIKYFEAKTELKNVEGQEIYYTKSKNKLNAIYGMMAQDPVKQTIDFKNNDFIERKEPRPELLDNSNKRAFMCYQWGVWVTAWARYRLEEGIRKAGDNFVYSDTDCVKHLGEIDWTQYNKQREKDSKKSGAFATDPKGITHYMGTFEDEGNCYEFCTLGAKKYCYRKTTDSPLSITIAGVTKRKGGKELEKFGGIEAFKPGFIFHEAGGLEAVYNDNPEIKEYEIDGHIIPITSNVVLRESTYTLGITAEYERLLEFSQKRVDI